MIHWEIDTAIDVVAMVLRDITKQPGFTNDVIWPDSPDKVVNEYKASLNKEA